MKNISNFILVVSVTLGIMTAVVFTPGFVKADFQVAYTSTVEEKPAVAYNSQTGKFIVAYLIETGGHLELRCQLHNADGSKSGVVLTPFGVGTHTALGRPAIAYSPNSNKFLVAAPVLMTGAAGGPVEYRFLNGDGSNSWGPDWDFGEAAYYDGDGVGSLHVVHNSLSDHFIVTAQLTVPDVGVPPWDHRNVINCQNHPVGWGVTVPPVTLADYGLNGIGSHSIAYAPIEDSTSPGGHYLFAATGFWGGVKLFSGGMNLITDVPLYYGKPEGGFTHPDIAYGEVEGEKRFLLVYSDEDNCRPGYYPCANVPPGEEWKQWSGVWGTYIDPTVTSYGTSPNNTPFPISFIRSHIKNLKEYKPRLSYIPYAKSFCVVWRELPEYDPNNDESRSHIRGNMVNYFVRDGLYGTTEVPLPDSDSNVVISDVTGTCPPSGPCYSNEDPTFPDVSANGNGASAAIVWQQKRPSDPSNLDVWGDFINGFPVPDVIVIGLGSSKGQGFMELVDVNPPYSHLDWVKVPWPAYNTAVGGTHPCLCNVDDDPYEELVVGLDAYPLKGGYVEIIDDVTSGYDHMKWIRVPWPAYNASNGATYPTCGDFDGDGKNELAIGFGTYTATGGYVEIRDDYTTGYAHLTWVRVPWPAYNSANGATHPAAGDFDYDGKDELAIGLGSYTATGGYVEIRDDAIAGFAHKDWVRVPWPAYNSANGATYPAFGDLWVAGIENVLAIGLGSYPATGGYVETKIFWWGSWSHNDWLRVPWPAYNSANGATYPTCSDVDGDCKDELAIGLGTYTNKGGYVEIRDDCLAGYSHLGWPRVHWPAYNSANGETRPALGW